MYALYSQSPMSSNSLLKDDNIFWQASKQSLQVKTNWCTLYIFLYTLLAFIRGSALVYRYRGEE